MPTIYIHILHRKSWKINILALNVNRFKANYRQSAYGTAKWNRKLAASSDYIQRIIKSAVAAVTYSHITNYLEQFFTINQQPKRTANLPSLCKGGCRQSRQEGCSKQLSATNHSFNKPQNRLSLVHLFSSKSAFQPERVARLSLVKRAVSAADREIV